MYWQSILLVFFLSLFLTWALSCLAWRIGLVDEPDMRRSHNVTTPRGGGLAIVTVLWFWLIITSCLPILDKTIWLPLCPTLLIAGLGLMDDLFSISAFIRLVVQFLGCSLSLYLMGGMHFILNINGWIIPESMVLAVSLLFLVWSINLYNFMDGINGLAGLQAVIVSGVMSIIVYMDGYVYQSLLWAILSAASAGFLLWNFPKAKIFLGDVGSYFLGSTFGVLLLESANSKPRWFWCGLILLGYFVVDATLTLMVRAWYRQPLFTAHKTHAFHIYLEKFKSNHAFVTISVAALNLFWLTPWAILVSKGYIHGFFALLIAYFPLVVIVWRVEAGKPISNPL